MMEQFEYKNLITYSATFSFESIVGEIYSKDSNPVLSLISPEESC